MRANDLEQSGRQVSYSQRREEIARAQRRLKRGEPLRQVPAIETVNADAPAARGNEKPRDGENHPREGVETEIQG